MPDLVLYRPAELNDTSTGGGGATGELITPGELRNLFSDLARLDSAQGDISLRKAFAGVVSADASTLLGAIACILARPVHAGSEVLLYARGDAWDTRADLAALLASETRIEAERPPLRGYGIATLATLEADGTYQLLEGADVDIWLGDIPVVTRPEISAIDRTHLVGLREPIVMAGDTVLAHRTRREELPSTLVAGQVVVLNQSDLAALVLTDQDGVEVDAAHYSIDLDAGALTLSDPLDLSGYTEPLIASHRIEHLTMATERVFETQRYRLSDLFMLDGGDSADLLPLYYDSASGSGVEVIEVVDSLDAVLDEALYTIGFGSDATNGQYPILRIQEGADLSGYAQPLSVYYRYIDQAAARWPPTPGVASWVGRPVGLRLAYPPDPLRFPDLADAEGEPVQLSACVDLGDMQASVTRLFDQYTWSGVWADAPIGDSANATFNDTLYPVAVTNAGAITERWLCRFTSSSTYEVYAERWGYIGTGLISVDYAPVNPETGEVMFTLPALGWGGGWVAGNALRFDTQAAQAPLWLLRATRIGQRLTGEDGIALLFSGDGA